MSSNPARGHALGWAAKTLVSLKWVPGFISCSASLFQLPANEGLEKKMGGDDSSNSAPATAGGLDGVSKSPTCLEALGGKQG